MFLIFAHFGSFLPRSELMFGQSKKAMKKIYHLLSVALITLGFTSKAQQTVLLSEDFESGALPAGWTKPSLATDGGWLFGNYTALQGSGWWTIFPHTKFAATNDSWCQCNKTADYLITPVLNLSGFTKIYLSYESFYQGLYYPTDKATVEVTTNGGTSWTTVSTITTQYSHWVKRYVDLSAYAGNSNVKVAFKYNDGGTNLPGFGIDNVKIFSPSGVDAGVEKINNYAYQLNGNYSITGTIRNYGANPITSTQISWRVNGGTINTSNVSLSAAPNSTVNFTHPIQLNINSPILYNVEIWTSNPNGSPDLVAVNDTAKFTFRGLSSAVTKKVMLEDFTGSHCGYCVDGLLTIQNIEPVHPELIPVAIHAYTPPDPMQTAEGDTIAKQYISLYPTGLIDRKHLNGEAFSWVDRSGWSMESNVRKVQNPVVAVTNNVNYNAATRLLTVDVISTFVGAEAGDLRVNCYILEDSVTGPSPAYDQSNYYSSASAAVGGTAHPYYNLPAYITNFSHNHVMRKMLGGSWGLSGSLPSSITAGQTFTQQFNYTLPASWDENQVRVVGFVQRYDSNDPENREILNSERSNFITAIPTGIKNFQKDLSFLIFPNPANDEVYLKTDGLTGDVKVSITNELGQLVYTSILQNTQAEQTLKIDTKNYAEGFYFITLKTETTVSTKKLLIHTSR